MVQAVLHARHAVCRERYSMRSGVNVQHPWTDGAFERPVTMLLLSMPQPSADAGTFQQHRLHHEARTWMENQGPIPTHR